MLEQELQDYLNEMTLWQQTMETNLRREDSWLSLVGLEWLKAGSNTIGSHPANDIVLPPHAPAKLGVLDFSKGELRLSIESAVELTIDGLPTKAAILRDDHDPNGASIVKIDSISFSIIKRGNQYGLRLRDSKNPAIANFTGRNWFPIDTRYRVPASFVAYETRRSLEIINSLGMIVPMPNLGYLEFELNGESLRLEAFEADESQWWIIFKDKTSGLSSYGAGRFLDVQHPDSGQIWIDFNRAYNPPCVFTPYATCPLAPKENNLAVYINAGEQL